MTHPFTGHIENGRIVLNDRDGFHALIQSLDGKRVELSLSERTPPDLAQMRRWLHGHVLPELAKAAGYDPSEIEMVKQGLKERYLRDPNTQEVRSTESLSVQEYSEFIDHCRRYAAETFGIDIPDPR